MIKKTYAIITAIIMIFAFSGCNKPSDSTQEKENTVSEAVSQAQSSENVSESSLQQPVTTTQSVTTTLAADSSVMTTAEIIEYYKSCAAKSSDSITSVQKMTLAGMSADNGEGAVNTVFQFVKPIINKVLESNSTEYQGITGGYTMLTEADVLTAEAYDTPEGRVIEMTMREQTDGAVADRNSGSTGHAISVVGDISFITDQLNSFGLDIDTSEGNVSVFYTEPHLRVLTDENGKITDGTWGYTFELFFAGISVAGTTVENVSVMIDYEITAGNGFS